MAGKLVASALVALLTTSGALAHQPAATSPKPAAEAADPGAGLATAPAGAETWVITSTGGRHGQSQRWTLPDGMRMGRESLNLRGFRTELEQRTRVDDAGRVVSTQVRGRTTQGDAAESFETQGGRYRFRSPVDAGEGTGGGFYVPVNATMDYNLAFADALMRAPGRSLELIPGGRARLEPLTELTVRNDKGEEKRLQAYTIEGYSVAPLPVWFEGDRLFGFASFLNFLPEGWEGVAPQLSRAQEGALAQRAPEVLAKVARRAETPLAFTNVRIYDAEAPGFRENQTVVVDDGRIAAVGPAASTPVPAGARRIDGQGKTLVPGLWDNHMHYGTDATGPLLLAQGITSVRDPGNRPEESLARKARIEKGELLGPRIVNSMLIDGPGPLSAQVAVIVDDRAEALAAVQRAKREGFGGVKLYGSLDPALVEPIADEAKRLGLRVHGHVPRTMRPLDAVRAGYDELTHINWVMMQAMPDSVIQESNGLARFYGPGRYAADVNLQSPEMRAFLDELAKRGTAVDPTLAIFEAGYTTDQGELAPAYVPFRGTLPPQMERSLKTFGFAERPDISRERMRASFAKLAELTTELNRRGVPVLAGTDGTGLELVRDLELYVNAGMTPAQALATATIIPARVYGLERETGSIAPGKRAELVLVDGNPAEDVGDLRAVELVVQGDRIMQADALREAAGLSGPPRTGD